jgi:hypothetical protein
MASTILHMLIYYRKLFAKYMLSISENQSSRNLSHGMSLLIRPYKKYFHGLITASRLKKREQCQIFAIGELDFPVVFPVILTYYRRYVTSTNIQTELQWMQKNLPVWTKGGPAYRFVSHPLLFSVL